MTELEESLLNIATNKVQPKDLEKQFDEVAVGLLRKTKLIAGESKFLIREIEFYFSGEHYKHFDSYAHSNQYRTVQRQGEFGEWYFHRYKAADSYSKQKFRGLDITFGNKDYQNFGGILIRQIQPLNAVQTIHGISNIVGEIISKIGATELHKVATEKGKLAFDKSCSLHLENYGDSCDKPIYKAMRVIPKPDTEEQQNFYAKFYRYFNHPEIKLVRP
jgi:hypothetical protein